MHPRDQANYWRPDDLRLNHWKDPQGSLPDPVTVVFTGAAPADGRAHAASLTASHSDIQITETDDDTWAALTDTLSSLISAAADDDNPLGLPLTVLDAKPSRDTMAS